jgi:hypothetical protein
MSPKMRRIPQVWQFKENEDHSWDFGVSYAQTNPTGAINWKMIALET